MLVLQNRQNVCFPSKGWLSWRTENISQGTLKLLSATACSCGDRSLITQVSCFSCPRSTSSAEDSTGEVWGCWVSTHLAYGVAMVKNEGSSMINKAHRWSWEMLEMQLHGLVRCCSVSIILTLLIGFAFAFQVYCCINLLMIWFELIVIVLCIMDIKKKTFSQQEKKCLFWVSYNHNIK